MASMAPATLRTRKVQWACYKNFCETMNFRCLPCSNDQLSLFSTYLSTKMTYSSVNNYTHAVIVLHRILGLEPPELDSSLVKMTLLGIRNRPSKISNPRVPVTLAHLKKMFYCLDLRKTSHVMFWSCMLTLFRTLLRVSHVTSSDHNLCVKDVRSCSSGLVFMVYSSKTTHRSEPPRLIPISPIKSKELCAVYWVRCYLGMSPALPGAPLFRLNGMALTYNKFQSALYDLLREAGIDKKILSHSFRKGGATLLSAIGMPLDKIKERGGWKSDSVLSYISDPLQVKLQRENVVSSIIDDLL